MLPGLCKLCDAGFVSTEPEGHRGSCWHSRGCGGAKGSASNSEPCDFTQQAAGSTGKSPLVDPSRQQHSARGSSPSRHLQSCQLHISVQKQTQGLLFQQLGRTCPPRVYDEQNKEQALVTMTPVTSSIKAIIGHTTHRHGRHPC